MDKKYKLTISILASNRKDTIPKCLESLRPLLERVDSELIVTDTGCDEELLNIIRKYTDKIVKFNWCNDFAAARNVGLDMACGQWFMYIDDDEWFEDVEELVDFFNGKEEQEYVSANYFVRNYYTKAGKEYSEWVVGRIFRIYEGIKFEGRVHEYIEKKLGKQKQFMSYVHHYGYAFDTEEQRRAHAQRNISLLEKEIERNPKDARNYAHIYQEYRAGDEPEMMLKYVEMAMKNAGIDYKSNKISLCSTYVAMLWAYMRLGRYEELIKKGEEILNKMPTSGLARATMYTYLVEACMLYEEYDKCIEYAKAYIQMYKIYRRDRERYYREIGHMMNDTLKDHKMYTVYTMGIGAAIKKDSIEDFNYFLRVYDWAKGWDASELECLKKLVDMTVEHGEKEDSVYVFGMIFTDVQCSKVVMNRVQEIKGKDSVGFSKICDIIAKIAGQPGYRSLVQLITLCKSGNVELLEDMYKKIYQEDDNILMASDGFYELGMDYGVVLGRVIGSVSLGRWELLINNWLSYSCNKDIVRTKKYMDLLLDKESKYLKMLDENILKELQRRKK